MTQAPKIPVSVVITSYCNAELTKETIKSVLLADPAPAEIVVVDDASPDGAGVILAEWCSKHEQIRFVGLPKNGGVSAARNAGVYASKYDYVTNLDGDDAVADHRKFGAEYECCLQGDGVIAASACVRHYLATGVQDKVSIPQESMTRETALKFVLNRKWVPRDPMYSKRLFEQVGGFDESKSLFEDWDFKIRLIDQCHRVVSSGVNGTEYRIGGGGLSDRPKIELCRAENEIRWKNYRIFKNAGVKLLPYFMAELRLRWARVLARLTGKLKRTFSV